MNLRRSTDQQAGFTLLEVVVVVISVIILGVVLIFLWQKQ